MIWPASISEGHCLCQGINLLKRSALTKLTSCTHFVQLRSVGGWKKCCSKPNWLSPIPLLQILCNIGSYQISASTFKMECTKEIENHFGNASYIRETHTGWGQLKRTNPKEEKLLKLLSQHSSDLRDFQPSFFFIFSPYFSPL